MFRKSLAVSIAALLSLSLVYAETYGEKLKEVDAKAKTVTISVDKKDKTFKVDAKATVMTQTKVGKNKLNVTPLKDGLKGLKGGEDAVITTELKEGEEVVTKIVVTPATPQPKKKPEPKKEAN